MVNINKLEPDRGIFIPNFQRERIEINPALDFINGEFFLGVWLRGEYMDGKEGKEVHFLTKDGLVKKEAVEKRFELRNELLELPKRRISLSLLYSWDGLLKNEVRLVRFVHEKYATIGGFVHDNRDKNIETVTSKECAVLDDLEEENRTNGTNGTNHKNRDIPNELYSLNHYAQHTKQDVNGIPPIQSNGTNRTNGTNGTKITVCDKPIVTDLKQHNRTNGTINDLGVVTKMAEIYTIVKNLVRFYVFCIDENDYDLVALWLMSTYFFPIYSAFPYLYIGGTKNSGKTTLMQVIDQLAFNVFFAGSISPSALFRTVDSYRATMLVDEREDLASKRAEPEFRTLLLNGYKRGAYVSRSREAIANTTKTYESTFFDVFSPKAIANITGIEDILGDRCIDIIMTRPLDKSYSNHEIDSRNGWWQATRDLLYLTIPIAHKTIWEININIKNNFSFNNREWELWKPIIVMAHVVGIADKMIKFAEEKTSEKRAREIIENPELLLLKVLQTLVTETNYYKIGEIVTALKTEFEEEESEKDSKANSRWINARWVGRAMNRFRLAREGKVRRIMSRREYYMTPKEIELLAVKYGIKLKEKEKKNSSLLDIKELILKELGDKEEAIDFFINRISKEKGIPKEKIEKIIEALKRDAMLLEPRDGFIKKL